MPAAVKFARVESRIAAEVAASELARLREDVNADPVLVRCDLASCFASPIPLPLPLISLSCRRFILIHCS